ncbi:MAG: hypothetical protein VYE68_07125, partial [Acidobacteriota bacterium]|nr:hypothetical protein [Acidobacteriota bacterium]
MLEETDRLTRLVDRLLLVSRADTGDLKLSLEPVDLGALADEVVAHLVVLAEEKEQTISIEHAAPESSKTVPVTTTGWARTTEAESPSARIAASARFIGCLPPGDSSAVVGAAVRRPVEVLHAQPKTSRAQETRALKSS